MRCIKKSGRQSIGKPRGGWNTKIHLVSANDKLALGLTKTRLLMDKAYEGDETRKTAEELGYITIVPPKVNRNNPWKYDKELYKQRNIVERLFRRLKEFRRIFTRYEQIALTLSSEI